VSLKESIEGQLKIPTTIKWGGLGSLDVWLDGARIFSKKQEGRSPKSEEIIRLIQAKA